MGIFDPSQNTRLTLEAALAPPPASLRGAGLSFSSFSNAGLTRRSRIAEPSQLLPIPAAERKQSKGDNRSGWYLNRGISSWRCVSERISFLEADPFRQLSKTVTEECALVTYLRSPAS